MTEELKNQNGVEELEEDIVVTIEFEDGEVEDCVLVCVLEYNEKLYAALTPVSGEEEFYFYNYEDISEEEFQLSDIETEEEFNEVADVFFELMEEEDK